MIKPHEIVLETDTDGILVEGDVDIDKINAYITDLVTNKAGAMRCTLSMEKEGYERGFIHKMKNYILLKKDKDGKEKVIIHGANFVSSRLPKLYDAAVQNIISYAIWDKISAEESFSLSMDIRSKPVTDFQFTVKMSKNVREYSSSKLEIIDSKKGSGPVTSESIYVDDSSLSGVQVLGLARKMSLRTGITPEKGMSIPYLICLDPITGRREYEYFSPNDTKIQNSLDYTAYEEMILRLFSAVNIVEQKDRLSVSQDWTSELLS